MGIKVAVTVGVSMVIIAALILSMTNPTAVGPLGVLAFFACTYLFFVCLFFVLIVLVQRITARFAREKNQIQLTNTPSNNKSYYYSTVVALVPVIYVGMQSVGGAGLFEIILLSLFEVLACFYVYKRY